MRQVPHYLIIGSGCVAQHFSHYFNLLNLSFQQWSRKTDPQLKELPSLIKQCNRILILISDSAIESFIQNHSELQNKTLIHFSGCLTTTLAHSAHPLMTFNAEPYSLEIYQKIPFILEEEGPRFTELFPDMLNSHFYIPRQLKPLYHAYCVMSNNFTTLLWQHFFSELQHTFKLPKETAFLYLEQTLKNNLHNSDRALTGPLVRGDEKTIKANLQSLTNDPFQTIYQAFVDVYQQQRQ